MYCINLEKKITSSVSFILFPFYMQRGGTIFFKTTLWVSNKSPTSWALATKDSL